MTKILKISIGCIAILGLLASVAAAGVDKAKLVGKWSGEIAVKLGEHAQKEKITIEFKQDGKVVATAREGKTEEGKYEIKKDIVVLFDKEGKEEVHLANIALTDKALTADFLPAQKDKVPPGLSIKLSLTRGK